MRKRQTPLPPEAASSRKPKTPNPVHFWDRLPLPAAVAGLLLLTALAYLPLRRAGFVWDDCVALLQNDFLRSPGGIWKIWTTCGQMPGEVHYWPLVYTSFWIEFRLWGDAPLGFHMTNLLLHLANTFLFWRLLTRMGVRGAWLAAPLFGVHPVHAESVAWVVERKDVLSGFFYLLTFYFFIRSEKPFDLNPQSAIRNPQSKNPQSSYLLAIACFVLALLSKSVAVTLGPALLIWYWWREGRLTARHLRRVAPFLIIGVLFGAVDAFIAGRSDTYHYNFSLAQRAVLAGRAFWFYAGQLAWPRPLPIYPRWTVDPADWRQIAALLATLALPVALWLARRRIGRAPLAATLFYGLTLGPTLGLVSYSFLEFAYVADRFQYLACAAPLALLVGSVQCAVGREKSAVGSRQNTCTLPPAPCQLLLVAAAAYLLFLGALTWRQAGYYESGETFFRAALAGNTDTPVIYNNLGSALLEKREWEAAEPFLRRAVALNSRSAQNHDNLSVALINQGKYREAVTELRLAIENQPSTSTSTMSDLAWCLAAAPDPALHNPAEALQWARKAVKQSGGREAAYLDVLAIAQAASGQFVEAIKTAGEASALAREAGQASFARQIEARQALFQKHEPYWIPKPDHR